MSNALGVAVAVAALLVPLAAAARSESGPPAIVIGQSAALSGPAAELGRELRAGALAYFDQVNRRGGVHGRRIVLETLDDAYVPDKASANYRSLIEEHDAFALFGCIGAATCAAALPVISAAKVPFVGPANGNQVLRSPFNRYLFNVRASFADEARRIIDHLVVVGVSRIAVLHPDHAPGRAALASTEAALKNHGLRVAAVGTYPNEFTPQVEAGARALARVEPQAVVVFGPYKVAAGLIKEMKKLGQQPQFMTLSVVGSKPLAAELGEDGRGVGISQVVPYPWVVSDAVVREYHESFVRAAQGTPSFTSLEGFISAKVLVEGLRRAGPQPTREKFIAAMESMRDYDVGGLTVSYSPADHGGSKYVDLTVIGKDRKILR
jgi:ABC-type branched-subunit amino acid transport system substrate-binding protein